MTAVIAAVNAKYIHSSLAARSLAAYAAQRGVAPLVVEATINEPYDRILERIYLTGADVLLLSCYIWNWEICRCLADDFRLLRPESKIFLGGPQASFHADRLLRELPFIDGIIRGEGEAAVFQLLRALDARESLACVPSLTTREMTTPDAPPLDLAQLPFCYGDLEELRQNCRIVYYESSRGCPFRCSYCLSGIDRSVRFKPIDRVLSELDRFLESKITQVKFVDRTFNCRSGHADAIWRHLIGHDNGFTNFHFEITADLLSDDQLELLRTARPGLFQFEIGVQSTYPPTLEAICRRTDWARLSHVCQRIAEMGNIHLHLDLIAGLPLENFSRFTHSFDDVYLLGPDQLQLGFLKLLPGSPLEAESECYGLVCRAEVPYEVLYTREMSARELFLLRRIARVVDCIYNCGVFQEQLDRLLRRFPRPYELFLDLTHRFGAHGYFDAPPSRKSLAALLDEAEGDCHADQPPV